MQNDMDHAGTTSDGTARCGGGLASRRRHVLADGGWRETVTEYTPEPWLLALKRDRTGLPVRPGHRPGANR
jgi:hypothetical protein